MVDGFFACDLHMIEGSFVERKRYHGMAWAFPVRQNCDRPCPTNLVSIRTIALLRSRLLSPTIAGHETEGGAEPTRSEAFDNNSSIIFPLRTVFGECATTRCCLRLIAHGCTSMNCCRSGCFS